MVEIEFSIGGGAIIQSNQKDKQKDKVRARYQSARAEGIEFIAAAPQENFFEDKRERRVAIYARVSTDDVRQTSSYELQKSHYLEMVDRHEGWNLVEIYADEGLTGTSLKRRDDFNRMIADCEARKIDLSVH